MGTSADNKAQLETLLQDYDIEIIWVEETASTNDLSSRSALADRENVVIADVQTDGHGRLGRSFVSAKGGLYESLAICLNDLFPEGEQPDLNRTLHFPLLVALGVMRAVQNICERLLGVDVIPDIKWPNDLQIAGKKICGILCRAAQSRGRWYLVAGIGVNVSNPLPEELKDAACLKDLISAVPEDTDWENFRLQLASEVFIQVYGLLKDGIRKSSALLDDVETHCITIGKNVEIPERSVRGRAIQIGDDGSLCVETGKDTYEVVKSGDVILVIP